MKIDDKAAAGGIAALLAKVKAGEVKAHNSEGKKSDTAAAAGVSLVTASAATAAGSSDPIDLSSIDSAIVLQERFSAAHLTAELTRVGLKAGGTHEQKAQRLFMLKGNTIDKLPLKVRATA